MLHKLFSSELIFHKNSKSLSEFSSIIRFNNQPCLCSNRNRIFYFDPQYDFQNCNYRYNAKNY